MDFILFFVTGAIALAGALAMLLSRNAVHSALFLLLNFGAIAVLFLLLQSPFLFTIQLTVYAGAIMVLFLYVVMLLNAPQEDASEWDRAHPLRRPGAARWGSLLAVLLVLQLGWALSRTADVQDAVGTRDAVSEVTSVREIGRVMFTDYVFAFEATSILILVALVGAILLASRREAE